MATAADKTVKKSVPVARKAGLAKRMISFLGKRKAAALREQVAALESELASLRAANAELKAQLNHSHPESEELSRATKRILKLFFDYAGDISMGEIVKSFHLKPSVADYHIDVLLKRKYLRETPAPAHASSGSGGSKFGITSLGRRYILQNSNHTSHTNHNNHAHH